MGQIMAPPKDKGLELVSELSTQRIFNALDDISKQMSDMQVKMEIIVRLEERVNFHDGQIETNKDRLNLHDERIRSTELKQSEMGNDQATLKNALKKLNLLETAKHIQQGQKETANNVYKWASGVLAALVIWLVTRGGDT